MLFAVTSGLLIIGAYYLLPARFTGPSLLAADAYLKGLEPTIVRTATDDIHALNGGEGEPIVFLHGVYARKEHWSPLASELAADYSVFLIDLPGFGENSRLSGPDYRLSLQAKKLEGVIDTLGFDRFHIAANSMGATIGLQYYSENPERVASIAFIGSPLGFDTPVPSDMDIALGRGDRPLVVKNKVEFEERVEWLFPNSPFLPTPVLKYWRDQELSDREIVDDIWQYSQDISDINQPTEIFESVDIPILVLWCRQDRIFHVSGAAMLKEMQPNSMVSELDDCGHLPMLDRTKLTAENYMRFLETQGRAETGSNPNQ